MPAVADWSLRRRLALAIAILATVLFAMVAVSVVLLTQVRSQQHAVINRYFTAVSLSNHRFSEQLDAETAVRGYALTADPATLQPLRTFQAPGYSAVGARLASLLNRDSATLQALAAWDTATTDWYDDSAGPTVAAVKAHGRDAVSTKQVLAGKALFDANRSRFSAYSRLLVARRNSASSALKLRTTLLFAAVLLVAASLAVAGGGVWWGLRRWVLDPLTSLGAETRLVRSRELEHEVSIEGPAELKQLAGDVEEMRRDIVDQLAAVERARLEIEASRRLLVAQAQDLARSNRDLEQFAYVASHDLQEPLRKVASFCQMLERRYSGQLDERADQYIAFAVDGAKRMQELINDLLAFSRVGRVSETFRQIDLTLCLDTAVDNLAVTVRETHAEIRSAGLPTIDGDPVLLTQLFQNLIANSIKFRGEASPVVRIEAERGDEVWKFSCTDNGIGVEPQYAERIFVIFQRLHGKDAYPGTGIGLALCKRIVERHGGQIWLDTAVLSGCTVRWTLPVLAPTGEDSVSPPPQESA
ncbi:MAG TPA: ATP-binding protein [Mycobacteriales bacterium]|nr:ATP-binding protein [Mycobacteriales bacterium]